MPTALGASWCWREIRQRAPGSCKGSISTSLPQLIFTEIAGNKVGLGTFGWKLSLWGSLSCQGGLGTFRADVLILIISNCWAGTEVRHYWHLDPSKKQLILSSPKPLPDPASAAGSGPAPCCVLESPRLLWISLTQGIGVRNFRKLKPNDF